MHKMWHRVFLLVTLVISVSSLGVFGDGVASQNLCGLGKTNNTCICKRIVEKEKIWTEQQDKEKPDNSLITVADCARINLKEFPGGGSKLDSRKQLPSDLLLLLNFLDISHNQITTLDRTNKFSMSIDALETLILSYNSIDTVDPDFFEAVPNLVRLDLSHNKLRCLLGGDENTNILTHLQELQVLDLSYNDIYKLEENLFRPVPKLRFLSLGYNNWSISDYFTNQFNLGFNADSMTDLKLDNIGLKIIQNGYFKNFTHLIHLSMADNLLDNVPAIPYNVEHLDLSGNEITTLQANYLSYHSLKILKLNRLTKLTSIHHYAFYNLQALEELYLNDCYNLRTFNELVFGLISSHTVLPLRKLSLARNALTTLNSTYKYLIQHLEFLDLSNNPWKCDCNLLWMQEDKQFYNDTTDILCWSPFYLRRKPVMALIDEDLPDCYPEKYGKKAQRILIPILIILVAVLGALIAYLIYYAPNWHSLRDRGLGPQSPYNPARGDEA